MAGLTRAEARMMQDASLAVSSYTAKVAPTKLSVETVAGTAAAAGTELGSTTRPTLTMAAATNADPPVSSNSAPCTVVCGATGTVVALATYDSSGTPVRSWYGPLGGGSRPVVAGDSLLFATNSINMQISSP